MSPFLFVIFLTLRQKHLFLRLLSDKNFIIMRIVLMIIFFSLCWRSTNAQKGPERYFYQSEDLLMGSGIGLDFGLHYVSEKKYTFQLGASIYSLPATKPSDYRVNPIFAILTFGFGEAREKLTTYRALLGKVISLNEKRSIRANFSTGIAYNHHRVPTNWMKVPFGEGVNGSNYDHEDQSYGSLGLVLLPKMEFAFSKYFGLTIAVNTMLSPKRSTVGLGIGAVIGLVR